MRIINLINLLLISFVFILLGCSGEDGQSVQYYKRREVVPPPISDEFVWESSQPQNNNLYAIWGSSANDIFTVGYNGTILHFDGIEWSPMVSPTSKSLFGVWGSASNNVYATGDNGTLLHYDGTSWKKLDCITNCDLTRIWGDSETDIFITTFGCGEVLHFDGSTWDIMTIPLEENIRMVQVGIWGTSPDNVYAVGNYEAIFHWDGKAWEMLSRSDDSLSAVRFIRGIWGSSADDIYVVIYNEYLSSWCVRHFNGRSWKTVKCTRCEVMSIWGTGPDDVYAVGRSNFYASILHYDGVEWVEMGPQTPIQNIYLNGVWGSAENDIYIVGGDGYILHYSGDYSKNFFNDTIKKEGDSPLFFSSSYYHYSR